MYRLLQRGELPGRKVGGQWRFRMAEVDYWLDMRVAGMHSVDLRNLEGEAPTRAVSLSEALRPENALITVPLGTRREVVTAFLAGVTYPKQVDGAIVSARVWEREELSSTATVDGVAFLHTARWESRVLLRAPLVALGRLQSPVDFGAIDRTPTDLLFLLLAPDDRTHLTLLAKATCLCRDPRLLRELRAARTSRDVKRLLRASEAAAFPADPEAPEK